MSTKPYEPREGTLPDKVIGLLEINGGAMTSREISDAFATNPATVRTGLLRAVDNGLLYTYKQGLELCYTLVPPEIRNGAFLARPADVPKTTGGVDIDAVHVADDPFNAALWVDGELALHGIKVNDDGIAVLTATQTIKLQRLLTASLCD